MNRWSRRSALKIRSSNTLMGGASGLHPNPGSFLKTFRNGRPFPIFQADCFRSLRPPCAKKPNNTLRTCDTDGGIFCTVMPPKLSDWLIPSWASLITFPLASSVALNHCSNTHTLTHTQWTSPWILMRTHDVVMFYGHTEKMCCWGSSKCHLNPETLKLSSILSSPPFLSGLRQLIRFVVGDLFFETVQKMLCYDNRI